MPNSLHPFFQPRGVVVIGASTSPDKLGYGVARNLLKSGYTGAIHFVSRKTGRLFGQPLYTDLSQVPDPVDLAILIVPPETTPQALEDCGRRGIHAVILISSGFREAGLEGAILEEACVQAAQRNQIRLLGPNCIGIIDTFLPLDTTFLSPPLPPQGHIGFISQSGAFCAAVIDWSRRQSFGFSRLVSLGNQADINETDILPVLAEDDHTRVIALYLEGVSQGRRFIQAAREAASKKPVIALKVGRFEAGQKAAASHTGALAGSEAAFDAALEKAGVLRAATAEIMFDWALALETCPLPAGPSMAVLTNAGGPGVMAADALEINGLALAKLDANTEHALAALLPPAASVHDPVDMLASASAEQYARCLGLLLEDDGVDGVMIILPPPPMYGAEEAASQFIPVIQASSKPVVIALMGSTLVEQARAKFLEARIPSYPFPERAASALSALVKRAKSLSEAGRHPVLLMQERQNPILKPVADDPVSLMSAYDIPAAPLRLASTAAQAASIAAEIGFPVVMKIASPDILHKSDVEGVMLDLQNQSEVEAAFAKIMANAKSRLPEARLEGITLQRQVPKGQDVIIGMRRDAVFGPLMMFGSGGIEVEGLKDVAFALAPLEPEEARELVRKTWAGRKLAGYRSIHPADEAAVMDVLVKLSCLAMEHPSVQEIEINPLRVLGSGAIALDVRMILGETAA